MDNVTFPMVAALRSRSLAEDTCMRAYPQAPVAVSADHTTNGNNAALATVGVKRPTIAGAEQGRPPRGVPR